MYASQRLPLPRLDDDGHIDLETSMRLAIPRDRLQCFVEWGVARSLLTAPAKFDTGIVGWRNSVPIRVTSWRHATQSRCTTLNDPTVVHLEPMQWPVHVHPRVPPNRSMQLLCHPSIPLWCHARPAGDPDTCMRDNPHISKELFRIRDDSLTWRMHSSFDDWDAARLVNTFDQFLGRLVFRHPLASEDRKRKREGYQEWSTADAIVTRRRQCPMTLLVCIMFLVHAVAPSADDPLVLVFPINNGPEAMVVVLDPAVLQPCY